MPDKDPPRENDDGEIDKNGTADQPWLDGRKVWLNDFKEDINRRRATRETELKRLSRQDTVVFISQIFATTVALGLIIAGILLGVFGKAGFGTISGLAGLATGSALIPLRARDSRIEANMTVLQREDREDRARYDALRMIMLTDNASLRTKLMADFAARCFAIIGSDPPKSAARRRLTRQKKAPPDKSSGEVSA